MQKRRGKPRPDERLLAVVSISTEHSSGGQPHVEIRRSLEIEKGGLEEEDPRVTIVIQSAYQDREEERIEHLHVSELDGLIENLREVVEYARAHRVIPPAIGEGEVFRRYMASLGYALPHRATDGQVS